MGGVRFDYIARECRDTFKGSFENVPIVGLEHIEPYDMLLKKFEANVETTFTKSFKKGQILFGRRRAYQHKACVATFDGVCSGDITVIEPIEGRVDRKLLPFIIQNDDFFEHAIKGSNGALSPRVKWQHMASFMVNLPEPDRQKELADKLWAAYEVKQSYLKMIDAIDELVKSRFIEMFGNPISSKQNYPLKKLGECAEINLHRDTIPVADSDLVSFVPMPSVNEEGYLQDVADVEYGSVKKGFTYFKNGDILFAKITPCMENGKGAIAVNLTNNIGMGSTEFHVLRPIPNVSLDYWILALTRLPVFREKAAKNMTGTGGQKRVPSSFLSEFKVGLPPISAQEEFATVYKQANKSKIELRKSIDAIDKVIKSLINENL